MSHLLPQKRLEVVQRFQVQRSGMLAIFSDKSFCGTDFKIMPNKVVI